MKVGTKVDFNKLWARVDGKQYRIKSFTLNLVLNAPAACSVILAQGMNKKRDYKFNSPDAFEKPFTPIIVELYIDNQTEPIILFRGFIANISKTAARNANGSYVGTALACIAAPSLLQAAKLQGYKFWATKLDGRGPETALQTFTESQVVLNRLNEEGMLYGGKTNYEGTRFPENVGNYLTEALGYFVEIISRGLYKPDAVTVHKMQRGIDITPGPEVSTGLVEPETFLVKQMKNLLKRTDAFSTLRAMAAGPLYLTMVPTTSGAFDLIPEFPWAKTPLTTLTRGSYLEIATTGNFLGDVALVDAVYVPVGFSGGVAEGFATYPNTLAKRGVSGIARTVDMPPWMSPYQGYEAPNGSAGTTGDSDFTGTNKPGLKKNKSEIDERQSTAAILAEKLAKMAYNRVKSSGSTLQVAVPWYRLEFLDALGYLIKIEKPNENAKDEKDLYGYLNAATLTISSTTGGSSAKMKLGFSHVRSEEAQSDAFTSHPFWNITDTFRDNFAAVAGSVNFYNRADQISLQGDTFEDYLDEVKELMNG